MTTNELRKLQWAFCLDYLAMLGVELRIEDIDIFSDGKLMDSYEGHPSMLPLREVLSVLPVCPEKTEFALWNATRGVQYVVVATHLQRLDDGLKILWEIGSRPFVVSTKNAWVYHVGRLTPATHLTPSGYTTNLTLSLKKRWEPDEDNLRPERWLEVVDRVLHTNNEGTLVVQRAGPWEEKRKHAALLLDTPLVRGLVVPLSHATVLWGPLNTKKENLCPQPKS